MGYSATPDLECRSLKRVEGSNARSSSKTSGTQIRTVHEYVDPFDPPGSPNKAMSPQRGAAVGRLGVIASRRRRWLSVTLRPNPDRTKAATCWAFHQYQAD